MEVKCGSLEDPIIAMKKADSVATETEIKRERRRYTNASCSRSYEAKCHVRPLLLFTFFFTSAALARVC